MLSRRVVIAALLLATVAAVIVRWPAADGIPRLGAGQGLELVGLQGTVWSGSAAGVSYQGLQLGRVVWDVDPWALLGLRLRVDFRLEGATVAATGSAERSLDGELELHRVQARFPASWLQRIINEPFLTLQGDLRVELEQVRIGADGRLLHLHGQSSWQDARIGGRLAGELGTLGVQWRTESAGVILGSLADEGGALELNGQVTVTGDHYAIDALLGARGDQLALRQALELFGRPDDSGRVRLRIKGPMLVFGRGGV